MSYRSASSYGFAQSDLNFAIQNNIFSPTSISFLQSTMNSYTPNDCFQHRRYQEILRDNHNHYADQTTWNKNNEVIHTFLPHGYTG